MADLLEWRSRFPILSRTVYMISHSLGAMPARARDYLNEYADTWSTRGIRAWEEGWWEMPIRTGDLIGRIIGAAPGEVVMQQNVSICQSIVLSCFDWSGRRNKIVTDELNFPSNLYIYGGLQRAGARLAIGPPDQLLAAIDRETQLVSVSHVIFRNSQVQDLAAIAQKAHDAGALVIAEAGVDDRDVEGRDVAALGEREQLRQGLASLFAVTGHCIGMSERAEGERVTAGDFE